MGILVIGRPACPYGAIARRTVNAFVGLRRIPADANGEVHLIEPREMRILNQRFKGCDRPTDVLTFREPVELERRLGIDHFRRDLLDFGMVVVCPDFMEKKYRRFGNTRVMHPDLYLRVAVVHGLLHLLGYDHDMEDEHFAMRRAERFVAARILTPCGGQ